MEDFYYDNLLFHLITSSTAFSVQMKCKNTKVTMHPSIILWPNREVGLNYLLSMQITNATNVSLLSLFLIRNSNLKIVLLTHFQIVLLFTLILWTLKITLKNQKKSCSEHLLIPSQPQLCQMQVLKIKLPHLFCAFTPLTNLSLKLYTGLSTLLQPRLSFLLFDIV